MGLTNFPNGVSSFGSPVTTATNVYGTTWYVDNSAGANGNTGKEVGQAFATITQALSVAGANDTILVRGTGTDYDEAVTVSQAGLTLKAVGPRWNCGWTDSTTDTSIITIRALGVTIDGFYLRPNGATSGVAITCSEITSDDVDGAVIVNNLIKSTGTTALAGIMANGCPAYLQIKNNHFTWIVTAITATSAPNTSATAWEIIGNTFSNKCTNGIYAPLRRCTIKDNSFSTMTVACDTVGYAATNGDYNQVHGNWFGGSYSEPVYQSQTNDDWAGNFSMDAAETEVGDNGITVAIPAA